jgi:outer membrane receptor protein involved in Fe transport
VIEITGPVNTGKGRITGVELQGQAFADFEWLPDWARGFGAQANLTYIDAKTQQPNGERRPVLPADHRSAERRVQVELQPRRHLRALRLAARLTYNGRSSFRATQQFRGGADDIYTERAIRRAGSTCRSTTTSTTVHGVRRLDQHHAQDVPAGLHLGPQRRSRKRSSSAIAATTRAPVARRALPLRQIV